MATASRVRTPWRSRRARLRAWSRSVGRATGSASGETSDQRPAASGGPEGGEPAGPADGPPGAAAGPLPAQGAQRRERVVGDLAGPDEVPQRVEDLAVRVPAGGREELAVERRAARRQVLADGDVARLGRWLDAVGRAGRPQDLATRPDEGDPAVVAAEAPPPHPGHLAQRAELVQQPRLVARDPGREHVALEDGRRDRQPGQLVDDLGQPLQGRAAAQRRTRRATTDRGHALPVGQEARQGRRIDRFDLASEARQRTPAEEAQDLRVAPLAFRAARPELAPQERARRGQPLEGVADDAGGQTPATRRLGRQERSMRPGEPGQEPVERGDGRAEERRRDPDRRRDADAVAIAGHVLDRQPAILAADPGAHDAPGGRQLVQPRAGRGDAALGPGRDLGRGQVAQPAQQVVDAVLAWSRAARRSATGGSARGRPAPPDRAARAAPPGRAARAAGRDRGSGRPARRSASGVSPSYM